MTTANTTPAQDTPAHPRSSATRGHADGRTNRRMDRVNQNGRRPQRLTHPSAQAKSRINAERDQQEANRRPRQLSQQQHSNNDNRSKKAGNENRRSPHADTFENEKSHSIHRASTAQTKQTQTKHTTTTCETKRTATCKPTSTG